MPFFFGFAVAFFWPFAGPEDFFDVSLLLVNGGMMSEPFSVEETALVFTGSVVGVVELAGDGSGLSDPTRGVSADATVGDCAWGLLPPQAAVSAKRHEKQRATRVWVPVDRMASGSLFRGADQARARIDDLSRKKLARPSLQLTVR